MNVVAVVTQGGLGRQLVSAARKIVGDVPHILAVNLPWDATFDDDVGRLRQALSSFDTTSGILLVTDMFGSTPHNVAMEFYQPGKVEVVSGANLPMIVRLSCPGAVQRPVQDLAQWICQKANRSICSTTSGRQNPGDAGTKTHQASLDDQKDLCDD